MLKEHASELKLIDVPGYADPFQMVNALCLVAEISRTTDGADKAAVEPTVTAYARHTTLGYCYSQWRGKINCPGRLRQRPLLRRPDNPAR